MENDIIEVEKQRQEIIKRIQEKERLINLIKNSNIKGDITELKEFQKKYNEKKLEKIQDFQKPEEKKRIKRDNPK